MAKKIPAPAFEVIHNDWDGNGAHRVTVCMSQGTHTNRDVRKARDLARRSVSRPDLVKWTRLDNVYHSQQEGHDLHTCFRFTVSRLDRSHR